MAMTAPQWQAWCEAGATYEERKERLSEAPEELYERVLNHLRTVRALKKRQTPATVGPNKAEIPRKILTVEEAEV